MTLFSSDRLRRSVTLITLFAFLSSIAGSSLRPGAGSFPVRPITSPPSQSLLSLPVTLGTLTRSPLTATTPPAVILVQDLHCHPGVQRNIRDIISWIHGVAGVSRVCLEGASGPVDTSWLADIRDERLQTKILDAMVDAGRLTGAEYYAVQSRRNTVILGMENGALYAENYRRLSRILDEKNLYKLVIEDAQKTVDQLKKTQYPSAAKRLDRFAARYAAGHLSPERYYKQLQRSIGSAGIAPDSYPQIARYVDIARLRKEMRPAKAVKDIKRCIALLKERLPAGAFMQMRAETKQFADAAAFVTVLPSFARTAGIDMTAFPHIARAVIYQQSLAQLDPSELVAEEQRLVRAAFAAVCTGSDARDTAFLADYLGLLRRCISAALTAEEYAYLRSQSDAFTSVWELRARTDAARRLLAAANLRTEYYRVNTERNEAFLRAICDARASTGVVVAVAGGFHTHDLAALLEKRGISYAVVTPQIASSPGVTEKYERLAREQSHQFGSQAFALAVCSAADRPQRMMDLAAALAGARDRFGGWEGVRAAVQSVLNGSAGFQGFGMDIIADADGATCRIELVSRTNRSIYIYKDGALYPEEEPAVPAVALRLPSGIRRYARPFVVAVDGQSGAGKSFVSLTMARRLGAYYIPTGKLYRLAAIYALNAGLLSKEGPDSPAEIARIMEIVNRIDVSRFGYVFIDGEPFYFDDRFKEQSPIYKGMNMTDAFYDAVVSDAARRISQMEPVREHISTGLRAQVFALKKQGISVIIEGKAVAKEIFTAADTEVFIETTPENAAAHRAQELLSQRSLKEAYFVLFGSEATEQGYQEMAQKNTSETIRALLEDKAKKILEQGSMEGIVPARPASANAYTIGAQHGFNKYELAENVLAAVRVRIFPSLVMDRLHLAGRRRLVGTAAVQRIDAVSGWITVGDGKGAFLPPRVSGVKRAGGTPAVSAARIDAAVRDALAILPAPMRDAVHRVPGTIRIAFVPAGESSELFTYGKPGTENFHILINESLHTIAADAGDDTDLLVTIGLAQGLARFSGDAFLSNEDLLYALLQNRARQGAVVPEKAVHRMLEHLAEKMERPLTMAEAQSSAQRPERLVSKTIMVSDLHGGFDRLVSLLSAAIGHPLSPDTVFEQIDMLAEELRQQGIRIVINGDIPDRGPQVEKTFLLVKKLVDMGADVVFPAELSMTDYVPGNHDIYQVLNNLGLHLPWYEHYQGIDDLYVGYGSYAHQPVASVRELLARKRTAKASGVNSIHHWAEKLKEYMDYADAMQEKRTAAPAGDPVQGTKVFFDKFKALYAFDLDEKEGKDVLNNPQFDEEGRFFRARDNKDPDAENKARVLAWWKLVMGRNVGVLVYRGVRATDKMSINWWEDRLQEIRGTAERPGLRQISPPEQNPAWDELAVAVENIIAEQKKVMQSQLDADNWEWAVLDAIMYRNYESMEWNAMDWIYHNSWGGLKENGFLAQYNEKLASLGRPGISPADYLGVPLIQRMRDFYMKHFRLYAREMVTYLVTHGFLPIDNEGDVCIGKFDRATGRVIEFESDGHGGSRRIKGLWYDGTHYTGPRIFDAFDRMSADVRNFRYGTDKFSSIREAFALVLYLYADETVRIKPKDVKKASQVVCSCGLPGGCASCRGDDGTVYKGIGLVMHKMGITGGWINGHSPTDKLAAEGVPMLELFNGQVFANIDSSMAPKYGHNGFMLVFADSFVYLVHHVFDSSVVLTRKILGMAGADGSPVAGIFSIQEEAVSLATDLQKPAVDEMAARYVAQVAAGWDVVHLRGGRLFYDTTIDENLRNFLIANSSYYASKKPKVDDIKSVKKLLDITVDPLGMLHASLKGSGVSMQVIPAELRHDYEGLLRDINASFSAAGPAMAGRGEAALLFALGQYEGKEFFSGESYTVHYLSMAAAVARWGGTPESVMVALFAGCSPAQIRALHFSGSIEEASRVSHLQDMLEELRFVDGNLITSLDGPDVLQNYQDKILALTQGSYQDIMVLCAAKMQAVAAAGTDRARASAYYEIVRIYASLCDRVHAPYKMYGAMRDQAFAYSNKETVDGADSNRAHMASAVHERTGVPYGELRGTLDNLETELRAVLRANGIPAVIKKRVKSLSGTWEKIATARRPDITKFDDITDLLDFFVIAEDSATADRVRAAITQWLKADHGITTKGKTIAGFAYTRYDILVAGIPMQIGVFDIADYHKHQFGGVRVASHWIYKQGLPIHGDDINFMREVEFAGGMFASQIFRRDPSFMRLDDPEWNCAMLARHLLDRQFTLSISPAGALSVVVSPSHLIDKAKSSVFAVIENFAAIIRQLEHQTATAVKRDFIQLQRKNRAPSLPPPIDERHSLPQALPDPDSAASMSAAA